jgi:hypothetical protein
MLALLAVVPLFVVDDLCGSTFGVGDCAPRKGNEAMPLYLVDQEAAARTGAFCLDGSRPGYYYTADPSGNFTHWLLYFKGGGWCYDEDSCAARARGEIGSSTHFPKTFAFSGLMDSEPSVNPDFAHFNRVVLWYCDGASFTGNADAPVFHAATNQTLYYRGKRVLDLLLDTLAQRHGLGNATHVLVSGGSAGGLAAYHHADHVGARLAQMGAPLLTFKAAPVSGLFAMHDDATGTPLYAGLT